MKNRSTAALLACAAFTTTLVCLSGPGSISAAEPVDVAALEGILPVPKTGADKRALDKLKSGLNDLFGVVLPALELGETQDWRKAIVLGRRAALQTGAVTQQQLDEVTPGGHVIECGDGRIVIAGPDAWSTYFGVLTFLERQGLHYFTRSKRRVSKPESKIIRPFTVSSRPTFLVRPGWGLELRQTTSLIADPRKGADPELFDRKKTGSDLWIDHSAGYLVPKRMYYDEHPEYYSMLENGKRIAKDAFTDHRTPLCFANPDVTRISVERALQWVALQPDPRFFMITNGDGGWCQCPGCKGLDHAPFQHARRLLKWANPISAAIGRKFPDRICITFAYGGSDQPPPDTRPEKNLWICGSTGAGNIPFWDHAKNKELSSLKLNQGKIESWLKIAPQQFMVCEYQSDTYKPALIDSLQGRLQWYRERGLQGILFSYGHPKNFHDLWSYLLSRLLWDSEQDAVKLADGYIAFVYGKAAPAVKEFFAQSREQYRRTLGRDLDGPYPRAFYEDPFARTSLKYFAEAEKLADDKLRPELMGEEKLFIMDWMNHPLSMELGAAAKELLMYQLGRLGQLAGDGEQPRIAFAREVHALGVGLELKRKGALALVEQWMKDQKFPRPKVVQTDRGVHLPASAFMYSGWGPGKYRGTAIPCPEKTAVGIYVKGNTMRRSHKMEAAFELTTLPGDGSAVLDVEATDCDHEVPPATIRVEMNGQKIYEGQVLVVKHNWSRQSFRVPAGTLKKGENVVRFLNVTDAKSVEKWYERWYMLSSATLRFQVKGD